MKKTISAREGRARTSARRQGLQVRKSRRALPYGEYLVADICTNYLQSSEQGMSLDELEEWLNDAA